MINDSWRDGLHLEIGHSVCTYYHGAILSIKCIYKFLNGTFIEIDIIRIKLNGKFTTFRMVQSHIPVSSDSMIRLVLSDINQLGIITMLFDNIDSPII